MKKVLHFLLNKYVLTATVFVVWMTFFDQNDWMTQKDTRKQLQNTKDHIKFLTAKTDQMEQDLKQLQNSPERLEEYAREHYRMKKDNEDLYIIERK